MSSASRRYEPLRSGPFLLAVFCMGLVVVGSNILVQVPLNDWLTWGGLSYPVAFLVTDVLNRRYGPDAARRVAWFGFAAALAVSVWVASPRIALASGLAYLCAQLIDIRVFDRLRDQRWWRAPLISGVIGAVADTAVFFSVAFAGSDTPWVTWMLGDLAIKLAVNISMLALFRALMWNLARPAERSPPRPRRGVEPGLGRRGVSFVKAASYKARAAIHGVMCHAFRRGPKHWGLHAVTRFFLARRIPATLLFAQEAGNARCDAQPTLLRSPMQSRSKPLAVKIQ